MSTIKDFSQGSKSSQDIWSERIKQLRSGKDSSIHPFVEFLRQKTISFAWYVRNPERTESSCTRFMTSSAWVIELGAAMHAAFVTKIAETLAYYLSGNQETSTC